MRKAEETRIIAVRSMLPFFESELVLQSSILAFWKVAHAPRNVPRKIPTLAELENEVCPIAACYFSS